MYSIEYTGLFIRQAKLCKKRVYDIDLLEETIQILAETGKLPPKYRPHKLIGNYSGCWECHIKPDWILVWKQDDNKLILLFTNTGTHSAIF